MAMKMFCDRCGAEINPSNRVTYASVRSKSDVDIKIEGDYELCEPCANKLQLWMKSEETEGVEEIIWHEVTSRALTDEEKTEYIEQRGYADYEVPEYMFTCEMPDDGQEVLIATSWGVSKDVCSTDSDELNYLYGLEDHGDWDGVLAWAAMPKYKGVE